MKASLLAVFSLLCIIAYSQQAAPGIKWQKSLGGTATDQANAVAATADGGCVIAGFTNSNDSDVTGNHGQADYFIVKLNSSGSAQWKKVYGGTSNDYATSVQQTTDGGYIVAGYTASSDGNVTGHHYNSSAPNNYDYWILKLDVAGNIVWKKCFGGGQDDYAKAVQQTSDGGYIIAGYTNSVSGDITNHKESNDVWIVKVDASGILQWQKDLGGPGLDYASDIKQTADGGYIVAANSRSNDGDVSGHHGNTNLYDYWVIKLDNTGTVQWQKSYGGGSDEEANSIALTSDGGYVVAGYAQLNGGDITGIHSSYTQDYWVIKLNSTGTLQWQKALGGNSIDIARSVQQTKDGNYIVTGSTLSASSGDVSANHGLQDIWLTKINNSGTLLWQKTFGGTDNEFGYAIAISNDNSYFFAGSASSKNGDVSGSKGFIDAWVVKLKPDTARITQTIRFPLIPYKINGDPDFELGATASSGLPVTYTSSDTNVISIVSGSKGHIKDRGTSFITASQAGNSTYAAATPVINTVTVSKYVQSITFPTVSPRIYGGPDFALSAVASSGLPVTYTSSDTNIVSIVGGNKGHIKKTGIVILNAFQAGNNRYDAASPAYITVTVNKAGQNITFPTPGSNHNVIEGFIKLNGTATSGLPITYTSSDTGILTISHDTAFLKKDGTVTIRAVQSGNENYYVSNTLTNTIYINGVSVTAPYTLICPNTSLTFTATVYFAPAGTSYQWKKNRVDVGTNSPNYTDSTLLNNDSILVVASYNGKAYASKPVRIGVQAPVVNIASNSIQVCQGSIYTINAYVSVPGGPSNVTWKKNNVNVFTRTPFTYSDASLKDGDSVWCVIGTGGACAASTPGLVSNKLSPKVLPTGPVSATINYQPSNYKLCVPGDTTTITFHAVGTNGGTNPSFQWFVNNVNIPNSDTSFYTLHGLKSGDKINCIYTSNQTCTTNGIKGVLSNTVTLATTQPLTPKVTIAQSPDTTMCYGTKIRFKTSSIYGSGSNPIYQWMRNGQPVGTNSDIYYDSTLINGDSVWCVMTTDYPCAISPAVASNKLRPRIDYGLPPAPPTITGPSTVTAGKQHVGYVVPLYGAVTYLWSVPAGASIYTGQHTYQVLVNWGNTGGTLIAQTRNSCGYSDKTRLVVTVTPGLQSLDGSEEASTISGIASGKAQLYPNPATTNTTVSFTAAAAGKYIVQVADAKGRILQVKETNAVKGRNTININVSGYAKGSYFIRLTNKDGRQQATFTLVVAR